MSFPSSETIRERQDDLVRIRHITDADLKRRIIAALAAARGCSPSQIPEWFELDDADFVDLLNDLKDQDGLENPFDSRE